MTYYANLDAAGLPIAFYNDDIYPLQADGSLNAGIPSTAITITEAQWLDCISNNGLRQFVGGVFVPCTAPVPPPVVPQTISDRQFFQQLAAQGIIPQNEALAAVQTGAIPSEMQPLVSALPAAEQFAATMKLAGATQFNITDGITLAIAQAYGWTSDQLNAFWSAASLL